MIILSLVLFSFASQTFCDSTDGGKAPRIVLNDGNTMPVLGLGTFLGFDERGQKEVKENEVELPVLWALNSGYRLIDTASAYHNEEQVGKGVKRSKVPREHVFIVTKLGLNEQRHVIESLRASLGRLNTSYVDLYLIHNPVALKADDSGFDVIDYLDTWKSMEEAKRLGLAKSIGISNFNSSQIERLLANCTIKPSVLQVEVNINLAQNKLLELTKKEGIAVMAYTPFGSLFSKSTAIPPPRKNDPVLVNLANKYGKTTPQIILRYLKVPQQFLDLHSNFEASSKLIVDPDEKKQIHGLWGFFYAESMSKEQKVHLMLGDPVTHGHTQHPKSCMGVVSLGNWREDIVRQDTIGNIKDSEGKGVQRGVIPIPKSVHKDRVQENINVFDFKLTAEEMDQLAKFNKDYRSVWPSFWQDHPYYPFEKKDVPDPDLFKAGLKQ